MIHIFSSIFVQLIIQHQWIRLFFCLFFPHSYLYVPYLHQKLQQGSRLPPGSKSKLFSSCYSYLRSEALKMCKQQHMETQSCYYSKTYMKGPWDVVTLFCSEYQTLLKHQQFWTPRLKLSFSFYGNSLLSISPIFRSLLLTSLCVTGQVFHWPDANVSVQSVVRSLHVYCSFCDTT